MHRVLATLVLAGSTLLRAHDPGLSSVRVVRTGDAVVVHAAFANADFAGATAVDADRDGAVDAAELDRSRPGLLAELAPGFAVRADGAAHRAHEIRAVLAENRDVELTLYFEDVGAADAVAVDLLARMARGHRCYAALLGDGESIVADALLTVRERALALPPAAAVPADTGFGQGAQFFVLGVEHILIGFDHLAFLVALLAAGGGLRRVVGIITAFTVAHSLTLAAAALGLVRMPALPIEIAIAASIVVVAAANLARRHRPARHRWTVAFAFGLVHGFGFANVLADLEIGAGNVLVPLVTFNLGVEAGQVAFAAVVLPLLAVAARRRGLRWVQPAASVAVGLAGLFWLCERLAA
jgi:hydrogenase/urease accessory protein HupE